MHTIVLRHQRENLKKCSLRGIEKRQDFRFFSYPGDSLPPLDGYIMLTLGAPPLEPSDAPHGLFVLDATWRYAHRMHEQTAHANGLMFRSIPPAFRTAYPRRQVDCSDPERGLASIEAIFVAYVILQREGANTLLDNYYWKEMFLRKNKVALEYYHYSVV